MYLKFKNPKTEDELEKDETLSGMILGSQWLWPLGIVFIFVITAVICIL